MKYIIWSYGSPWMITEPASSFNSFHHMVQYADSILTW